MTNWLSKPKNDKENEEDFGIKEKQKKEIAPMSKKVNANMQDDSKKKRGKRRNSNLLDNV